VKLFGRCGSGFIAFVGVGSDQVEKNKARTLFNNSIANVFMPGYMIRLFI
jgi:hypothetical protein